MGERERERERERESEREREREREREKERERIEIGGENLVFAKISFTEAQRLLKENLSVLSRIPQL